ncbi:GspE/PulE family protein [Myxococcota bacterium]|nr:GspE/PulE family protein [Myxococcota bacterium]
MISLAHLGRICDILVGDGLMHEGQVRDAMVRHAVQEKRILIEKRSQLRKLLGRQRVIYEVGEIEVIASFDFPIPGRGDQRLTEATITEAVARHLGLPYVVPDPLQLDYRLVTETFQGAFAERHLVMPIRRAGKTLTVAVANPFDTQLVENLERFTGSRIEVVVASKADILRTILEYHGFKKSMDVAAEQFRTELVDIANLEQFWKMTGAGEPDAEARPVVQAVWFLFNYAFEQRASDIHIEPKREFSLVRLRIDGVLHKVHMLPKVVHPAIVSRIKTLARMDIAEKRRPQDGRIKTEHGEREVELRVSSTPTVFGEKVVIRIFDPEVLLQDVESLGFFPREQELFESFLSHTTGLILVSGPTGSGKTTTLYSSLQYLSSPTVNVCTIEDPIEMVHEEFNQMAVQPKIGFDFAHALRTVLRQDPDVVMVGEIRDNETAELAIQAALTGHLVLSTLHTNDAATAVTRLLDLGVMPFLISSVLVGVVAQRLMRTNCVHCRMDTFLSQEQVQALAIPGGDGRRLRVRYGAGCARCRGTGYKGRTGVFEVMPINEKIRQLVHDRATAREIKREAMSEGMLTLREYAIKRLAQGVTTYEEVVRVTSE